LTAELLKAFETQIESITLTPSNGGVFEVIVDSKSIFSKKALGRYAQAGEITRLFKNFLEGM